MTDTKMVPEFTESGIVRKLKDAERAAEDGGESEDKRMIRHCYNWYWNAKKHHRLTTLGLAMSVVLNIALAITVAVLWLSK